ncbi:hypothetical protein Esi_0000_0593 [Ectocarpus siliculosus]|uniref:Bromo domain-containing protein n=1 Tax=Ectocarpus siliculosus TaxID=2880 RepID=D8LBQ8_ECTSI|nr:hypothetical protein Esi_0000_0593 [Ectocarpus siliculosus]|eukprot:CBN76767.1 hypothetical protein Esi_0000_0593 [Ectocarpus siliculosus]
MTLIDSLLGSADSEAFREPVDWRGLGLHDYPNLIKRPMDLGTVKVRLERGTYPTAEACAADVRLIWDNCRTYNTGGVPRDLHKAADALSKRFETRFAKILAGGRPKSSSRGGGGSNGNGKGPAKPKGGGGGGGGGSSASVAAAVAADPTTEDRRRLARHLGRARMEDVTAAVHEIDRGCPEALMLRRAGHQRKREEEEEEEGRSTGGGCADGGGGGNDSVEALVGTTAAVEIEVDVDALDAWTFCAVERVVAPHAALRRASRVTAPRRARKKRPAAAPAAVPSSSGRSSSSAGRGGGGEGGAGAGDAAGAEAAEGRPSKRSRPACGE